jgi:signal transduction histidine kinase
MNPTPNTPASQLYLRAAAVLAVLMSIGFTWLVLAAGALKLNVVNMLIQVLVIAIIATLLWIVIRRFRRTRQELQVARANAEDEAALLRKRSAFIYEASSKLSSKLASFEQAIAGLDENDKNAGPLKKKTAELRELLNKLDTIGKLEANMALTSSTKIDAAKLLDQAAVSYQDKFLALGASLQLSGSESVIVNGDEEMLKQVFIAIIDNAAKFVPQQTGLLDIEHHVRRQKMVITFTDNGPGIEASKLPELFQPFSRTDGVMAFNRQGQGLSLYISRLCIEIMGGSIDLQSSPGNGTTVTITLPVTKTK